MKLPLILLASFAPILALGQMGVYAYNAAENQFFKLKSTHVESTVIGPIVRTCTDLTYENSFRGASEVSFNFDLPETSALGGFGYFIGKHYIEGRLMDKWGAAQIYNDVRSGQREPGLMDQSSPMVYRCQIFPVTQGSDIHIRLWTVGMVQAMGGRLVLPKPSLELPAVPGTKNWTVRTVQMGRAAVTGDTYSVGKARSMTAVAQRFKDGRYYVVGLIHLSNVSVPSIQIVHAYYEDLNQGKGGSDVTGQVADMVRGGNYFIWASDAVFGDPRPNAAKRLRVVMKIGGEERTLIVSENETMNLLGRGGNSIAPCIFGLRDAKSVFQGVGSVAFSGWMTKFRTLTADFQGRRLEVRPSLIREGSDAARLWAQQMLASKALTESDRVLAFSLKYGVPSAVTSLIAVPNLPLEPNDGAELLRGGY